MHADENQNERILPRFLSVPQAARLCGVTRNTMYIWVKRGKVKAYHTPGRKNLIRPTDLVKTMRRHGLFVSKALLLAAGNDCGDVSAPPGHNDAPLKPELSVPEAARLCDVPRCTLWRWVREGRLPAARHGKRTRFKVQLHDLVAFMDRSGMYVPEDLRVAASSRAADNKSGEAQSTTTRVERDEEQEAAILVVDCDETTRRFAVNALGAVRAVHAAESCVEGLQLLVERQDIGVAHVNLAGLGEEGFRVVGLIMQLRPDVAIIAVVREDERMTEDVISTGRVVPLRPDMLTPVALHSAMDRALSVRAALLPHTA